MKWLMAVCVILALGGCSGSTTAKGGTAAPIGGNSGTAAAGAGDAPATTAATTPSAAASAVLPDGRSPVYLTGLVTGKSTVTFDLIQFLTGDAAKTEWKKQHPEQPDGPDNDY